MNAHLEGEIFVGSSKEGLGQALQVLTARSEVKDVKPLLVHSGIPPRAGDFGMANITW